MKKVIVNILKDGSVKFSGAFASAPESEEEVGSGADFVCESLTDLKTISPLMEELEVHDQPLSVQLALLAAVGYTVLFKESR